MLTAKASDLLGIVIEIQTDLFTPDILDRMDAYYAKLKRRGVAEKVIAQAQSNATETITEICRLRHSFPLNSYFQNVHDSLRWAVLLRFQRLEKTLRAAGDAELPIASELEVFLRRGLIDDWNDHQALMRKNRSN